MTSRGIGFGLAFLLASLGPLRSANAELSRSLMRSPEALAMGGAYTAIVEDRDAPFYNPAGVAAYEGLSLHMLTIDPTASEWVVTGWRTMQDLKNPSGATLNAMMGQNVYVQAPVSAAVLAPGFALIGFYDTQAALYAKNQSFPKVEYGYQTTSGAQAAFGFSIADGRKRGRGKKNAEFLNEWRFGLGAKYITRTGGYRLLTAAELFSLDPTTARSMLGSTASGYGFDLGIQRVQKINQHVSAYWGTAFLNIGDITFDGGSAPVRGDLSTGIGLKYRMPIASLTLAYDLQQLNHSADFGKRQNLGAKLGLPLVDLFAGFHQGFLTYGAAVDIWIARFSGTIYREELGPYPQQDPESRYALRVDLKMDF